MKYELSEGQREGLEKDDTSKTETEFRERFLGELLRDQFNNNEKINEKGKGRFANIVAKTGQEVKTLLELPERVLIDFAPLKSVSKIAEVNRDTKVLTFNTNSVPLQQILEVLSTDSDPVSQKSVEYLTIHTVAHEFHHVRMLGKYPQAVHSELDRKVPYREQRVEKGANIFAYNYMCAKAEKETDPELKFVVNELLKILFTDPQP